MLQPFTTQLELWYATSFKVVTPTTLCSFVPARTTHSGSMQRILRYQTVFHNINKKSQFVVLVIPVDLSVATVLQQELFMALWQKQTGVHYSRCESTLTNSGHFSYVKSTQAPPQDSDQCSSLMGASLLQCEVFVKWLFYSSIPYSWREFDVIILPTCGFSSLKSTWV